ncbi:MAG: hypothetical protein QOI71_1140 [Gaiellales bacterium]|jgi:hypothetical protein|nr:hypothetical protein [Gaiellales bacterium]MDX6621516.1 hypothetical protein [Gaiellales bacterium]
MAEVKHHNNDRLLALIGLALAIVATITTVAWIASMA